LRHNNKDRRIGKDVHEKKQFLYIHLLKHLNIIWTLKLKY